MSRKITHFETHDVRFPTSLTGDGSDAMNTTCDYSSAYISIFTDGELPLVGHGMTFTIGRGNDIVCQAIIALANKLIGRDPEDLFKSMGKAWDWLSSDSQLRWWASSFGFSTLMWKLCASRTGSAPKRVSFISQQQP